MNENVKVKLNNGDDYEPINIILTEEEYPIAYNNKIEELVEQGLYADVEMAKLDNPRIELECEIYYHKHSGLFAVECGAVDSGCVYSPYSGELCGDADEY